MKAHRKCDCGTFVHVKRAECPTCGHNFRSAKPTDGIPAKLATPKKAAPKEKSGLQDDKLSQRVAELQNHVNSLEKQVEKAVQDCRNKCQEVDLRWRKWYNLQGKLIYERAFKHFGGQGDLYHHPVHGENKALFKEMSDETGIFKAPSIDEFASTDEPSESQMQQTVELVNTLREPVERDLEFDGITIDDAMSIDYAEPRPKKKAPSLACAIAHVKYLVGQIDDSAN